uniref:BHLH domain-containing protein n=1 Tax=Aegilops tauschii subsp. strangulata TaxID=200361 RepID=A0A453RZN5_AEGTS
PSGPTCHRVHRPPPSISNTSRLKICEKKPKIETKQKGWRKSLPPLRGDGGGDDDGELGYRGTDVSPSDRRRRRLVPRLRHPRGPPGRCLRRFPVGRLRLLVQSKSAEVGSYVNNSDVPKDSGSNKRLRSEPCGRPTSKACREKVRRDKLNDRYIIR